MKEKLTLKKVLEDAGWLAEWEARGKAIGEVSGEARGKAIGEASGEARGKAIGEASGRERMALDIARKMKEMGDSVERIYAITGLSIDTVEQL